MLSNRSFEFLDHSAQLFAEIRTTLGIKCVLRRAARALHMRLTCCACACDTPPSFSTPIHLLLPRPETYRASFAKLPDASNLISGGRSGSIVISTHDRQFIVKMIPKEEREKLAQILPDYLEHIKTHPDTLLVRFVGLHEVRLKSRKVRALGGGKGAVAGSMYRALFLFAADGMFFFLVQKFQSLVGMENALSKAHGLKIDEVYDLKGACVRACVSVGDVLPQDAHLHVLHARYFTQARLWTAVPSRHRTRGSTLARARTST